MQKDGFLPYLLVLVLFYLFSFELQQERIALFSIYGYIYAFSLLFFFTILTRFQTPFFFKKKALYLFFLIQFFTLLFSIVHENPLSGLVLAGHQILFFMIFVFLIKIKRFSKTEYAVFLCNSILLVSAASLFFAFVGFIWGGFSVGPFIYEEGIGGDYRLTGWYGSANRLGTVCALGFIMALFKIQNKQLFCLTTFSSLFLKISLPLFLLGLVLTGSRGAFVAFVISLTLYFITQKDMIALNATKTLKYLFGVIIIGVTVITLLNRMGYDAQKIEYELFRTETIAYQLGQEGDGGRMGYWKLAFQMLRESSIQELVFGHGLDHFYDFRGRSAHSGFIVLMTDRGILILALFLYLVYFALVNAYKQNDKNNIGTLGMSILTLLMIKNATNTDIPSSGFAGIVFIMTLVLIFVGSHKSKSYKQTRLK